VVSNLVTLINAAGQLAKCVHDERNALKEVWESPSAGTDPPSTPNSKCTIAYQYGHIGHICSTGALRIRDRQ